MTAQIIDLAVRREAIRKSRADQTAISMVWPAIFITSMAFWFAVGFSIVHALPFMKLL